MAKSKAVKEEMINDALKSLNEAESVVFAEYRGIDVSSMTDLRKNSRSAGVKLKVFKNTLFRKATEGTKFEIINEHLKGPLIYGVSSDAVAPAKLLVDYANDNDSIVVKGGVLQGAMLDSDAVNSLAKIPPREQLLAMLVGVTQAPISGFIRTLNSVPAQLVRVLSAICDKKNT
jgi:large subunit ribosomal protein L10|tara:strand:+ start:3861 stop:4382 length:522 start_codon:yes stop_codon:yes gene_type:complete